jgi:hemolysin III
MVERALTYSDPPKPLLRGVSHQIAFFAALAASAALVLRAHGARVVAVTIVFGAGLTIMFGTSALLHRGEWAPPRERRLARLDHAAVFVAMAGGFTPLFALVPSQAGGHGALAAVWIGAALGMLRIALWPTAPRWLQVLACVVLAWALAGEVLDRASSIGPVCFAMFVASGLLYSVGAVVYGTRRPVLWPRVFGYHEVFHALIVAGTACLFAHVVTLPA